MQGFLQDVGALCKVPQREMQGNSYLKEYYPEVNLNNEIHNISSGRNTTFQFDACTSVLRPINEGPLKRIFRTYYESGFMEALNAARDLKPDSSPVIASLAEYTHRALQHLSKLKEKFFMRKLGLEHVGDYVETRDWNRSYIRCMAWHPHVFKIGVAGIDDIIRIYTDEPTLMPVLKSMSQKSITSMAWRPLSVGELAVGCAKGVCLWTMENTHITRASLQEVLLKHPNHCPVTSLSWSENGVLLATTSIGDSDVLVWNVDKGQNTVLRRITPPCTFLKWSPDDSVIFCATAQKVFRIWHTQKACSPERWVLNTGRIQSACWSPCGTILLFVTTQDSCLYRLQYRKDLVFNTNTVEKSVLPIADLSKCTVGHREVGGLPQNLVWDAHGRFVAITFKDTSCIAIFATGLQHHNLNITPTCFLTGVGAEFPACICFQSCNGKNQDAVLTIGWSSGRLQFCPLTHI